jgi:hypothetical protein
VGESLNQFDVYLFLHGLVLLHLLDFVIFKIINFLAVLSMQVCLVACYKCLVLNKPFHRNLLINFMNKSYESNLKLNIKLNGKITNHTPNNPMCGCKSF